MLTTHCRSAAEKCRSDWIEGSATLVIVASRITMNCARQTTTTVTSQWRSTVVPVSAGEAEVRSVMKEERGRGASGPSGPDDRSTTGPSGPSFRTAWSVWVVRSGTVKAMTVSDALPLRADAQRNLERILEAARAAFAERGLEVGVEEIARRAGVGKATFFRRFPTKDALVLAVLEGFVEEVEAAADRAVQADDPLDGLREFLMHNMT